MTITMKNPLLACDAYKMGHMTMFPKGINKVYSYLVARSEKNLKELKFFGLKYYIEQYIKTPLTEEMGEEFIAYRNKIMGNNDDEVNSKIRSLCKLGYFPVKIKAVEEGKVYPVKNVLLTITNTIDEFYWVVGFLETLLLKLWFPISVASMSYEYRKIVDEYFDKTVDEDQYFLKDYTVHDFGYRGDSSEESAGLSGAAHLLNFKGSDTVIAYPFVDKFYPEMNLSMSSVPATEHSVMSAYRRVGELIAFMSVLNRYPEGIVSIVSDTYDFWNVMENYTEFLKDVILSRNGKTVFRPDSGNPVEIICGVNNEGFYFEDNGKVYLNEDEKLLMRYKHNNASLKGALRILDEKFGHTVNSKGYKVLNPKIGLIYGDGMYLERYKETLRIMEEMGYAASNLVIGVGGILRNVHHGRDFLGFAIKSTYVEINNAPLNIEKDPITDSAKKSHKGLLKLEKTKDGYVTIEKCSKEQEEEGELKIVYCRS